MKFNNWEPKASGSATSKATNGISLNTRRAQGATLDELARSYNVSRATISRLDS
jgi:DNA-binding MurR/RpiR family transcriptional regulator